MVVSAIIMNLFSIKKVIEEKAILQISTSFYVRSTKGELAE
jgi:hypothetical protein